MGQAWLNRGFGTFRYTIAWDDEKGEQHESEIAIEEKADKHSRQDLIIEVFDRGATWKLASSFSNAEGGGEEEKPRAAVTFALFGMASVMTVGAFVSMVELLRGREKFRGLLKAVVVVLLGYVCVTMAFAALVQWNRVVW